MRPSRWSILTKSARKPSRLIRMVVGENSCVPFERILNGTYCGEVLVGAVAESVPYSRARTAANITMVRVVNRPQRNPLLCETSARVFLAFLESRRVLSVGMPPSDHRRDVCWEKALSLPTLSSRMLLLPPTLPSVPLRSLSASSSPVRVSWSFRSRASICGSG